MASSIRSYLLVGATLIVSSSWSPVAAQPGAAPGAADHEQASSPEAMPETTFVSRQVMRGDRPALLGGVLSAPSQEAPRVIGRAFLDSRPAVLDGVELATLTLRDSAALPRGHVLRYQQAYAGLEVVGGDTVVRIDDRGRVRWTASEARPRQDLDVVASALERGPALTPRDVVEVLGRGARYEPAFLAAADPALAARLVIYPAPGAGLRLAYDVELPLHLGRMQKLRAYVDADTGVVYAVDDRVRRQAAPSCSGEQTAYVYETNPVDTPSLTCVSLSDYLAPGAAELRNADVVVQNCLDRNGCRSISGGSYHFCDVESTAAADQAGHFTDYTFESDTAAEDAFAEVQMFYHVNRAFEVARGLGGFDGVDARPLTAVVNFRLPSFAAESECSAASYEGSEGLQPFDNALFVPKGGLFAGFPEDDAIIFGQGTAGDFAYDGDVVYHEFGHAVMFKLAPDLPIMRLDTLGLDTTPGGMHEGYADLMTMFVTGDPEIGEYAAQGFDPDLDGIRNIENAATCPGWLTGELHDDSLPITGAMWEARVALAGAGEDASAFDQAVFAAQRAFGAAEDFESAAQKTLAEIESGLGAEAAATAREIFAARGLIADGDVAACASRVLDGSNIDVPYIYLPGVEYFGSINQVPAPVQFRYEIDERVGAIELDIGLSVGDSSVFGPGEEAEPQLALLLQKTDGPITWSASSGGVNAMVSASDEVSFEDVPDSAGLKRGVVTIKGPFDPGVYHLQLTNRGPTWLVAQLSLDTQPYVSSGSSCQAAPAGHRSDAAAGLMLLFAALALALRRRARAVTRA